MIDTLYFGTINFQWWEYIILPGYFMIIYIFAARIKTKNLEKNPEYKYMLIALNFKIFAGLFFGFIYVFYYRGGDTINYYQSTIPLVNLLERDFGQFFNEYFFTNYKEITIYNVFDYDTGFPLMFLHIDPKTFMVCKLTFPFLLVAFESYFVTTLLLSAVTFIPLWKLYRTILSYFPTLQFELALGTLFIPSVLFWGGGIMKDTFTFAATAYAIVYFSKIIDNPKYFVNYIWLLLSLIVILSIKPYILNILVPSFGLWIIANHFSTIKNVVIKALILPIFTVFIGAGAFLALSSLGSSMDKFSLDNALETAVITQQDLMREEQYGSNNFNIGKFEASIPGIIAKFPIATISGLFRPTLMEVGSPVMLLSAFENLFMIILLILTLVRIKVRMIIQLIFTHPFLIFSVTFVILFAFMIGLTTSNFGALVRFKIPLMPFFMSTLLILYSTKKIIASEEQ